MPSATEPPLICESFESSKCDPATQVCDQFVECNTTHGMINACYAAWVNDTLTGVKIKLKGCWLAQGGKHNNCDQDRCVADKPSSTMKNGLAENLVYHCCCSKPKCNEQVWVEQSTAPGDGSAGKAGPSNPSGNPDAVTTFAYVCAPIVVLTVLILGGYWLYRRCRLKHTIKRLASTDPNGLMMRMKAPSSPGIPLRSIQLEKEVAKGRYGTVWKAHMGNDELVAVKKFPPQDVESWSQEQAIYCTTGLRDNKNILRFIGAECHGSGPTAEYWLITEFQENGSVHDYLKTHTLTLSEFLSISSGVLHGLAFLHEEQGNYQEQSYKPTIVHRDFKSRNVLLGRDLTPCISDFGLALKCVNGRTADGVHNQVGTRRYMAPEVLQGATDMNAIAFVFIDIYAAALVLWELLSRCTFVSDEVDAYKLPFDEVGPKPSLQQLQDYIVDQKKRPVVKNIWRKHPQGALICSTIEEMWDMEPEARITAGLAFERLTALRLALVQSTSNANAPAAESENVAGSLAERSPLISDYQARPDVGALTV